LTLVFPDDGYPHYQPQQNKKYGLGDRISAQKQTGQPNCDSVDAKGRCAAAEGYFGKEEQ
jgi:hypothetical protein